MSIMFDLYCPSNVDIRIQLIRRRYQQTQSKPNCYRYMTWLYINSLKNLWISKVVHFTGRSNELGEFVIRNWNNVDRSTQIYTHSFLYIHTSNYEQKTNLIMIMHQKPIFVMSQKSPCCINFTIPSLLFLYQLP